MRNIEIFTKWDCNSKEKHEEVRMRRIWKRVLSLLLVVAMVVGDFVPVGATNVAEEELVTEVSEMVEVTGKETIQDVEGVEDTE